MSEEFSDAQVAVPDAGRSAPGLPVIDHAILERVLSVGGADLRADLLAQIITDLTRLEAGLRAPGAERHAIIAHELKGLAATIGATALADLATRFQLLVENGDDPGGLKDMLCEGIAGLRVVLSREATLSGPA